MEPATVQPELYVYDKGDGLTQTLNERVFAPVCLLDHMYYLEKFPAYYFIVRKDKYTKDPAFERVCLYQEGVVNEYLKYDNKPFTLLISNDLRDGRRIETIYRDMEEKVREIIAIRNIKK